MADDPKQPQPTPSPPPEQPPPPPPTDEQVEAELGSYDFDEGQGPAEPPSDPGVVESDRPSAPPVDDDPEYDYINGGQPVRIKLSELKRGYLPNFQQHIQNLASREQNFARTIAGFNQAQAGAARYLQGAIEYLQSKLPAPPNPQLIHSDLLEYNRQKAIYDIESGKLHEMATARNTLVRQFQNQQRQDFAHRFQGEQQRTLHHLPDLKDPVKDARWKQSARALGAEIGYSPQELSQVYDHRLMRLIDWAIKGKEA